MKNLTKIQSVKICISIKGFYIALCEIALSEIQIFLTEDAYRVKEKSNRNGHVRVAPIMVLDSLNAFGFQMKPIFWPKIQSGVFVSFDIVPERALICDVTYQGGLILSAYDSFCSYYCDRYLDLRGMEQVRWPLTRREPFKSLHPVVYVFLRASYRDRQPCVSDGTALSPIARLKNSPFVG